MILGFWPMVVIPCLSKSASKWISKIEISDFQSLNFDNIFEKNKVPSMKFQEDCILELVTMPEPQQELLHDLISLFEYENDHLVSTAMVLASENVQKSYKKFENCGKDKSLEFKSHKPLDTLPGLRFKMHELQDQFSEFSKFYQRKITKLNIFEILNGQVV